MHIGPHNIARAERGVDLERTATARAVEERNQELGSAREDVREIEGSLDRARLYIAQLAQKLALLVRKRLERSPGRDRTRLGVEPIMANALDRVKAAEAKYTAMVETAEKLESSPKKFKGTADTCYSAMIALQPLWKGHPFFLEDGPGQDVETRLTSMAVPPTYTLSESAFAAYLEGAHRPEASSRH